MTEMEEALSMERDNLSSERILLVSVISKAFPSAIAYHTADDSGDDSHGYYGWVVYVNLPTGQVSFHVGDDTRTNWFSHLPVATINPWDGHSTEEKWLRVSRYTEMEVSSDG